MKKNSIKTGNSSYLGYRIFRNFREKYLRLLFAGKVMYSLSVMAGVRGTFGKQVVFRQRNGKVIVSAYLDMSHRVLSPKQLKVNALMSEANAYSKDIINNIEKRHEAQIRLDLPSTRL